MFDKCRSLYEVYEGCPICALQMLQVFGSSPERLDAIEGFQFKVWLGRTSTYTGYPVFFFKEFSFGATVVTIHRKM
jgi:hypothetical protein